MKALLVPVVLIFTAILMGCETTPIYTDAHLPPHLRTPMRTHYGTGQHVSPAPNISGSQVHTWEQQRYYENQNRLFQQQQMRQHLNRTPSSPWDF